MNSNRYAGVTSIGRQSSSATPNVASLTASSTTPSTASPYGSSPSPGQGSFGNYPHGKANGIRVLRKYTMQLPKRPALHSSMDFGFPDIFPQKADQEEDQLSESNVRNGFLDKPIIPFEHSCAHDSVYSRLSDEPKLATEIANFMSDILVRKEESSRIQGPNAFKIPNRFTLNDQKKEQWMQELANTGHMLAKVARNIPHGFKGERLLEVLTAKQVPLARAVWYIKIVGLSELQSQRNRHPNTNYHTVEWTYVVTRFLTRQLEQFQTLKQTLNQTRQGHKASQEKALQTLEMSRKNWESRWSYSLRLAKWQYNEALLDQRTMLKWVIDTLEKAPLLDQTPLILMVLNDYMAEYQRNRTLMKLVIEIILSKLSAVSEILQAQSGNESKGLRLEKSLMSVLQTIFSSTPDMFVSPRLWHQHYPLLRRALYDTDIQILPSNDQPAVRKTIQQNFELISKRNAMFYHGLRLQSKGTVTPPDLDDDINNSAEKSIVLQKLYVLDTIYRRGYCGSGGDASVVLDKWIGDISSALFGTKISSQEDLEQAVAILCRWACSRLRWGAWRPFVVAPLLRQHIQTCDACSKRSGEAQHNLQNALMKYLHFYSEQSMVDAQENENTILLFGDLIRQQIFSYQAYIARLIALGALEGDRRQQQDTRRHLSILECLPLYQSTKQQLNQRNAALTASGKKTDDELKMYEHIKEMIHAEFPALFTVSDKATIPHVHELNTSLTSTLLNAPRFIQLKISRDFLFTSAQSFVVKNVQIGEDNWRVMTSPGASLLNAHQFSVIARIMELVSDVPTLLEFCLWVLDRTNEAAMYPVIVDLLRQHRTYWILLGAQKDILGALIAKYQSLLHRGQSEGSIQAYAISLIDEGVEVESSVSEQILRQRKDKPTSLSMKATLTDVELINSAIIAIAPASASTGIVSLLKSGSDILLADLIRVSISTVLKSKSLNNELDLSLDGETSGQREGRALQTLVQTIKSMALRLRSDGNISDIIVATLNTAENQNHIRGGSSQYLLRVIVALLYSHLLDLASLVKQFCLPRLEALVKGSSVSGVSPGQQTKEATEILYLILISFDCVTPNEDNGLVTNVDWLPSLEQMLHIRSQLRSLRTANLLQLIFDTLSILTSIEMRIDLNHFLLYPIQEVKRAMVRSSFLRNTCSENMRTTYMRFMRLDAATEEEKALIHHKLNSAYLALLSTNAGLVSESIVYTADTCLSETQAIFSDLNVWSLTESSVRLWLLADKIVKLTKTVVGGNADGYTISPVSELDESAKKECVNTFVRAVFEGFIHRSCESDLGTDLVDSFMPGIPPGVIVELLNFGAQQLHPSGSAEGFPANMILRINKGTQLDASSDEIRSTRQLRMFHYLMQKLAEQCEEQYWLQSLRADFAKRLLADLRAYQDEQKILNIMQATGASYEETSRVLSTESQNIDSVIATLRQQDSIPQPIGAETLTRRTMLSEIRLNCLVRLRLLLPILPVIWQNPGDDNVDALQWVSTLTNLLCCSFLHGNGSHERCFELFLDVVSVIIEEYPKDLRRQVLTQQEIIRQDLAIPAVFYTRVARVLPFQTHNVYLNNLSRNLWQSILQGSTNSDPTPLSQVLNTTTKPWEWLEECGTDANAGDNEGPINLALFGAKKLNKTMQTYVRWFRLGFDANPKSDTDRHDEGSQSFNFEGEKSMERILVPSRKVRKIADLEFSNTFTPSHVEMDVDPATSQDDEGDTATSKSDIQMIETIEIDASDTEGIDTIATTPLKRRLVDDS